MNYRVRFRFIFFPLSLMQFWERMKSGLILFSSTKEWVYRAGIRISEGWNPFPFQVLGPCIQAHSLWVAGRSPVQLCSMTQLRWWHDHRAGNLKEGKWTGGRTTFLFWGTRWFFVQLPAKGKFPLAEIIWDSVETWKKTVQELEDVILWQSVESHWIQPWFENNKEAMIQVRRSILLY